MTLAINELTKDKSLIYASLRLNKRKIIRENKRDYPCNPDLESWNFTECSFQSLAKNLNSSCVNFIPAVGKMFNDTSICSDSEKLANVSKQSKAILKHQITAGTGSGGCLQPCTTFLYEPEIQYHHRNTLLTQEVVDYSIFVLLLSFEAFEVETEVEYFVVDGFNMVSSLGGSLGLFLGLSCASMITYCLEKIKHFSNSD